MRGGRRKQNREVVFWCSLSHLREAVVKIICDFRMQIAKLRNCQEIDPLGLGFRAPRVGTFVLSPIWGIMETVQSHWLLAFWRLRSVSFPCLGHR